MWKKNEPSSDPYTPSPSPSPSPSPGAPARAPATSRPGSTSTATIGPSISIKGDLSGQEDLLIEGQVEGEISLTQHHVTVGRNGRVQADIHGESITVEGEVRGNLYGQKEVVIRASGQMEGNITAPGVILENGCRFRGNIDMSAKKAPPTAAPSAPAGGSSGSTAGASGSSDKKGAAGGATNARPGASPQAQGANKLRR